MNGHVVANQQSLAAPDELTLQVKTVTTTSSSEEWRIQLDASQALQPFDHLVRVSTDLLTQSIVGQRWDTADFMRGVMQWANDRTGEVDLLASFAAWQKSKLDYNAVYTAWLMEAMSEEEFEEEALKYTVEIDDQDPRRVVQVAEKLANLLPFEISTSDLAAFLHADPRAVLDSIARFGQHSEKLRALLPADKRQLSSE
ncbi:hypothetical protein [Burkholderia multivorans]|uniref:hypothetical protein n=1 Tax=Burkholderia multivorans TaxID=87883 RepID=UPI00055DAAD2|nr:hypothetical protein [Burkholderia multivorans]